MNYILDTSVVLQWYNRSGELHPKQARVILDDLRADKVGISIPDILPIELLNVLIKGKGLSDNRANIILKDLFEMPIKIIGISLPVLQLSSKLMKQYNLAAYDAYFLALAQYEGYQLISDDQKAHGKIKDRNIIMLEDYPD